MERVRARYRATLGVAWWTEASNNQAESSASKASTREYGN